MSEAFLESLPLEDYAHIELEIGSARADLLCELAAWHPHRFYIGVEINAEVCDRARAKIVASGLNNLAVANAEGLSFLADYIPSEFLDAIHVYHPTPYPSAVGLREPLLSKNFEIQAHRTLNSWGALRILTDHKQYRDQAMVNFSADRWWSVAWQRDEFALRRGAFAGSPLEMFSRANGDEIYATQLARLPLHSDGKKSVPLV